MGTTPIYSLPFPEDTDLVIAAPQQFEALADAVEAGLKRPIFTTSTAATLTLDFASGDQIVRSTRLGTLTLAGTNYTAGVSKTVIWNGGATNRSIVFPAGWVFVSFKPTELAADKRGVLAVVSHGTAEGDVTAAWATQS